MTCSSGFLVSASAFPFFYALVGERNPRQAPKGGSRSEYSQLACDAFEVIRRDGPISKVKLGEKLGGSLSAAALDRGLGELWSRLRITRVDYNPEEGASWDVLYRWAPEAVREGISFSVAEALSALLSKYLECVVAADEQELAALPRCERELREIADETIQLAHLKESLVRGMQKHIEMDEPEETNENRIVDISVIDPVCGMTVDPARAKRILVRLPRGLRRPGQPLDQTIAGGAMPHSRLRRAA